MPYTRSAADLRKKGMDLQRAFADFGVDHNVATIDYLTKRTMTVDYIRKRFELMQQHRVPMSGGARKALMTKAKFDEMLNSYSKNGFSPAQQGAFDLLLSKGLSKVMAKKMVARKHPARLFLIEKFDFIDSMQLDPNIYGIRKLPLKYYMGQLEFNLVRFLRYVQKVSLPELAEVHAQKILGEKVPWWGEEAKKRGITARLVYLRYLAAIEMGLPITKTLLMRMPVRKIYEMGRRKSNEVVRSRENLEKARRRLEHETTKLEVIYRKINSDVLSQLSTYKFHKEEIDEITGNIRLLSQFLGRG